MKYSSKLKEIIYVNIQVDHSFIYKLLINSFLIILDSKVNLYGSTASGFCFKDSLIDIDVHIDNKNSIDTLDLIYSFLKTQDYIDVKSINNTINDKIICKLHNSDIFIQFTSMYFSAAHQTSRLFYFYSKLDYRFKLLAFCLRYLAKV